MLELMKTMHSELANLELEFDCINNGGCGIFAHSLCLNIRALGFNSRVRSLGFFEGGRPIEYIPDKIEKIYNKIKKLKNVVTYQDLIDNDCECVHFLVEIKNSSDDIYYMDSILITRTLDEITNHSEVQLLK